MSGVTVSEFAKILKVSSSRLKKQLLETGFKKHSDKDVITEEEKNTLLKHLKRKQGKDTATKPKKIVMQKKSFSEMKMPLSTQGRGRKKKPKTVSVEVRKTRVYVSREVIQEQAAKAEQEKIKEQELIVEAPPPPESKQTTPEAVPEKVNTELAETEHTPPTEKEEKATEKDVSPDKTSEETPKEEKSAAKEADDKNTRYGRQELHVTSEKAGRRKKKTKKARRPATVKNISQHIFEKPTAPIVHEVEIPENTTVGELAQRMSVKATEVIKMMMGLGSMVTINQILDQDTAILVVEEMGHKPKLVKENLFEEEAIIVSENVKTGPRAPVVTVMGHVDHGKTSLLDYICNTKVTAGEAGGITQHIGAYTKKTDKGERMIFLDTPGHAAFTAMRARGAKVTDIVIVIVAADDGVMPQTEEVIRHAKESDVPIIVAVNKIDKEGADPESVRQQLIKHDVVPEDWGGDNIFVNISAVTGEGVDALLEAILLQAEVLELRAPIEGPATGAVVESRLDKGRGPVATVLVQGGILKKGDIILSGHEFGRVRTLLDENGQEVDSAGPSTPVAVIGLSGLPNAGDRIIVVPDDKKAKEVASFRQSRHREAKLAKQQTVKLENAMTQMGQEDKSTLHILIKSDVQGSVEAIVEALNRLPDDEIAIKIISYGVGGITETDMDLAVASNALVIGFNVRADATARRLADSEGIDIRYYSVIYDLIEDVKLVVSGMLAPELREQIIGIAEVKDSFRSPKFKQVAGCIVSSGLVKQGCAIRVLRDNVVIHEGELDSLRRFKDIVDEVKSGTECGIGIKNYSDIRVGDQIEFFERVEIARTL